MKSGFCNKWGTPHLVIAVTDACDCVETDQNCTFLDRDMSHHAVMKTKELTPEQILSVRCLTCGAAPGEVCELNSGAPRTEPHRDRKLSAADAVEMKLSKRHIGNARLMAYADATPRLTGLTNRHSESGD